MCRIDCFISIWYFCKNSVWNEFRFVLKMRFGSDIIVVYCSRNNGVVDVHTANTTVDDTTLDVSDNK